MSIIVVKIYSGVNNADKPSVKKLLGFHGLGLKGRRFSEQVPA